MAYAKSAARVRRLGQERDITYVHHVSSLRIDGLIRSNIDNKDWLAQLVRGEIKAGEVL
jgi:hypothetical protein